MQRPFFTKLTQLLTLIVVSALWFVGAPSQLGGQTAYVIVNGNSMEPLYHRGDLVIIHAEPNYQIGDIVTYRHPQIGPVIHRIIGREVEHFIFKGDHNNFIDPYQPTKAELIGKAWVLIPFAGKVIEQARAPFTLAALAALAGVIVMAPMIATTDRKNRKRAQHPSTSPQTPQRQRDMSESLLLAITALAFASIALAAFAFTRPLTHEVSDELPYQQSGFFQYAARAPSGIYDSTTIQTGEPIFFQLTHAATFQFNYHIEADRLSDPQGTYQLAAEVSAANGWRRTIMLQPETSFSGNTWNVSGTLDLTSVQALMANFEQQTGIQRPQYALAIVPTIHLTGTLAGHRFQDSYAPRLEFRLDQNQIELLQDRGQNQDPLKPSQSGLIKYNHIEPNTLPILFFKLEVPLAREIAIGAFALTCVAGYLFGMQRLLHPKRSDQVRHNRSMYGALLIDIGDGDHQLNQHAVKVAAMSDLAKLAEKSGRMILHEQAGALHRYSVQDDGMCYSYEYTDQLPNQPSTSSIPPANLSIGVTEAWQTIFLTTLREKGTIAAACRTAHIDVAQAYAERMRIPAFAQAWAEARTMLRESLIQKGDVS